MGFRDNPFASYVAENEPAIDQYFIRPPYYDAVTERGQAARSLLLFGARGAGKSATRLTFYKNAWAKWHGQRTLNAWKRSDLRPTTGRKAPRNSSHGMRFRWKTRQSFTRWPWAKWEATNHGPLVVTLDDYSRILTDGLAKVELGQFISEVSYLVVEALLIWLAALEDEERDKIVANLNSEEEAIVIPVVQRFYLSRPDFVREASIREPLKLLNQAWHKRSKLWVMQRWDSIANLVGAIAQLISKQKTSEVDLHSGIGTLLKADPKQWNDGQFAKAILVRLADFARVFGFSGVTVLVDKVDETQQTNNSANSTASLAYPLLASTHLLEVAGFGWVFFLWDKVLEEYKTPSMPVRLDKIANATIQWENTFLNDLVTERIKYYSNHKVTSFTQLCESSVDTVSTLDNIIQICMKSPRELIRVLDTIVREHDDQYAVLSHAPRLLPLSVDRALDKYAVETVIRVFERQHLQQIVRLNMPAFINRDVQQIFRINDASARNRIRAWADAGIVTQTGSRPAEGGIGGKPAYEFSVTDHRVRRLLERNLSLGVDFDLTEDGDLFGD